MCIALPRCSATVDGSGRQQFKADLELWNVFLSQWNGTSMLFKVSMRKPEVHIPQVHIMSNASGSWGCAAYWNGEWFQVAWSNHLEFEQAPIAAKEAVPNSCGCSSMGKEVEKSHGLQPLRRRSSYGFHMWQPLQAAQHGPYVALLVNDFPGSKLWICLLSKPYSRSKHWHSRRTIKKPLGCVMYFCSTGQGRSNLSSTRTVGRLMGDEPWTSAAWERWFATI